jgi:hypothetical protein
MLAIRWLPHLYSVTTDIVGDRNGDGRLRTAIAPTSRNVGSAYPLATPRHAFGMSVR